MAKVDYKRFAQRTSVNGEGALTWDAGNGTRQCRAKVRNMSDGGLQLFVSRPLAAGWTACLTGELFECFGVVRYCQPADGGFIAGLEFRKAPYVRSDNASNPN